MSLFHFNFNIAVKQLYRNSHVDPDFWQGNNPRDDKKNSESLRKTSDSQCLFRRVICDLMIS